MHEKIAIAMVFVLSGCGSLAKAPEQPRRLKPADSYVHQATGFMFPVRVGAFTRSGVTEYNKDKTDVSAGYDKVAGQASVASTVYVYPAPPLTSIGSPKSVIDDAKDHLCTEAWEDIKSDIVRAHPDAEMIELGDVKSPSVNFTKLGHRAVFRFSGNFGGIEQPVHSEADLFCYAGNGWLVAYRTTAPATFDYKADLSALMRSLAWPPGLKR